MGFYSPHVILQTAKHLGINVLPACVLSSDWDFLPEQTSEAIDIRIGLRLVRGLSKKSALKLCKQRSKDAHKSLLKFLQENSYLTRVDLTALAAANALSVFGVSRRSAIWLAEAAPFSSFLEDTDLVINFAEESRQEQIHADFYNTGTSLGEHPASIFKNEEWHYDVLVSKLVTASRIPALKNKDRLTIFGMVIVRQSPPTAKGMVFLTLEDETGLLNLVSTPQVYQLYKYLINRHSFICATGVLQKQGDAVSIKIETVHPPKINEAEIIDITPHVDEDLNLPSKISEDFALAGSRNYY